MANSFLLLILGILLHHHYLSHIFLMPHRVNGFRFQQSSRFLGSATISNIIKRSSLKSSASSSDGILLDERYPDKNSSSDENVRESYFEEMESATTIGYPWSKVQDWALRDSLHKYTIRIPIKRKMPPPSSPSISATLGKTETSAKTQEDIVLTSFVLWRSLLQDVPELSGYPIDFLQARHEKMQKEQQKQIFDAEDDDKNVTGKNLRPLDSAITTTTTRLGVLPFLQDYEFASEGGICGYVYGLDGVSDGSRIQTSAVMNVKESLPKGYIQTSDGSASFELGRPLGNDERSTATEAISSTAAVAKTTLEKLSDTTNNISLRSASDAAEDSDGLLLRLGAATGILLAGATAINMLSHHMTVNVFWV